MAVRLDQTPQGEVIGGNTSLWCSPVPLSTFRWCHFVSRPEGSQRLPIARLSLGLKSVSGLLTKWLHPNVKGGTGEDASCGYDKPAGAEGRMSTCRIAFTFVYQELVSIIRMSRLQLAIEQISFAPNYRVRLLDSLTPDDWFRQPPAGVTHVAWQVGHLAFAEYGLARERIRGTKPQDGELISEEFLRPFGRDSAPVPDAAKYPSSEGNRAIFNRVHQQVLRGLSGLDDAELDKPILKSHSVVKTQIWALLWCAQHEAVHAGQIGL